MTPLRVLVVEDSEDDALLLVREMRQGGFDVTYARVETAEDMKAAVESGAWDVVISDYSMPRFSAPAALELLKTTGLDLPFIIVSGKVGEEVAVESMRAGARDFFLKGSLARLVPAIERELEQAAQRREKRKAEEANSQLAAIVESSSDAIIGRTLDGIVLTWNGGAERLYGYSPGEVLGRPMSVHVPADRAGEIQKYVERIRRGEVVDNFETVRIRKDGTRIDASLTVSPIRNISGEVIGVSTIARGITDRKRAEESIQKLLSAVEQAKNAIVMTDQNGAITYVNPAFQEIYGYSRQEALGRTPRILKSGRHDPAFYESFWSRLLAGQSVREEFVNKTKDGRLVTVESSVSPVLDAQGCRIGFIAVQDDVTERKRDQEMLAARERHFRSLIENAQDIITIIDMQGTIRFQSPAAAHVLGRPPQEFVGRSAFDFIHPDDVPGVREAIRRAVGSPESAQTSVYRFRHANGTWRTLEGVGKVLPSESEPQVVVNSRDVTESRAVEEQLRQAQKMEAVGRLAGGIAHDFNNLLTAILGYAQLAAARLKQEDPMRIELSEIEKAGQRAADLTRQLLAFSRKQVLQPRVISLNEIVGDTEKMLRRLIGEDIDFTTVLKDRLGSVRADTGQIEQVLVNLAVNSRDAMPKGGKLTIETSEVELDESYSAFHLDVQPGPYVLLAVSDTGTGMDAKTLSQVFEPFFTTKAAGKGTGLGLSTVYGIVKQSGGHVAVYSEPGVGTTFKIYLPRVEGLPERASGSFKRARQAGGTETVLVVEDEEAVRRLVCRSLEDHGYKTVPAASAADALLACEKHAGEIHLMLTDVVMPHLSGRELAQRIAALRPRMKVLFMSGYTDNAIVHHGVLDAGTPFIQKPFTPRSVAQKVREVLDAPEQRLTV